MITRMMAYEEIIMKESTMLAQFLREEDGQTTVEYLLIIAVIVVVISMLGSKMNTQIGQLVDNIFKGVNGKVADLMKSAGTGR